MLKSILIILIFTSNFTILPLAFLFTNKLTKHLKFNNMHFMNLNMLFDFIQVYSAKGNILTKIIIFIRIFKLLPLFIMRTKIKI
jgi:hypothetical protein